jgi:hypothetical protein
MTETTDTQPITGVAPVPALVPDVVENTPAVKRRVVSSDAEAALRERHARSRGEELSYEFRGVEYKLLTPMPAAFMVHAGQIQSGDDVDMREFVSAIRSAFVGSDGQAFVDALLDTDVDVPADAEFVGEILSDIVRAVSNRPPTS